MPMTHPQQQVKYEDFPSYTNAYAQELHFKAHGCNQDSQLIDTLAPPFDIKNFTKPLWNHFDAVNSNFLN